MDFSRKGCYKCGNLGHIAENCSSEQRLCYNCRQPGHESSACPCPRSVSAKQCYSCGGIGHIQAECPNLRVAIQGQKCYACGRFGHIARGCPTAGNAAPGGGPSQFTPVQRPAQYVPRSANAAPVKCFRCGGFNHMSRDCLAQPGTQIAEQTVVTTAPSTVPKTKVCYRCQQEGHVRSYHACVRPELNVSHRSLACARRTPKPNPTLPEDAPQVI
ncbi:hypothetical protein BKA62DRAFT_616656 [Auriculariales sp. MPI-PUGE-AT-0066]|nr:hypothetical protein BKA62DRAFT_616656 [Auriculariales sp. MPI-PUGE-AT-0066]